MRALNLRATQTIFALCVVLIAIGMSACAGVASAYKAADGLTETSYVVGEHYYAMLREVNDLNGAGRLNNHQLFSLRALILDTRPAVVAMLDAAQAYQSFASAENETELATALSNAAVAISRLVDAIKTVGGR